MSLPLHLQRANPKGKRPFTNPGAGHQDELLGEQDLNCEPGYREQNLEWYLCDSGSLTNIYAFPLSASPKNLKEPARRGARKNSFLILMHSMDMNCDRFPVQHAILCPVEKVRKQERKYISPSPCINFKIRTRSWGLRFP